MALLALTALPPVLAIAKGTASALLALTALPPVLAKGTASALLALTALPPVLAKATASVPPHSLHLLCCRPCRPHLECLRGGRLVRLSTLDDLVRFGDPAALGDFIYLNSRNAIKSST